MANQTYFEFVKDMLLDKYYYETTEEFREGLHVRLEEMFNTHMESAYNRGKHDGFIEGLDRGINLTTKSYETKM